MDFSVFYQTIQANLGGYVPQLLGAVSILLLGWILALIVRAAVRKGLGALDLNRRISTGTEVKLDLESGVSIAAFWVIILLTLSAIFSSLNLTAVSGPFSDLTSQLFEYAPHLLAGASIALIAWLLATVARVVINKALGATSLDEKLSAHAGMAPISHSVGNVVFWLILLLFIPAILSALQMEGLLSPLRNMTTEMMVYVPHVFAAGLIAVVGWIIAKVLRSVVTNLLHSTGVDSLGTSGESVINALDEEVSSAHAIGALAPTAHDNAQQALPMTTAAPTTSKAVEGFQISKAVGTLVFVAVLVPTIIAALDALQIEAISKPAIDMLNMMASAVPGIVAALLILVLTWIIGRFATGLLAKLLSNVGFDNIPEKVGIAKVLGNVKASDLIAKIAFFFAMLFAVVEASNQMGLTQVSEMVNTFTVFGGDVLLGSVIMVIGFWLANVAADAIERTSGSGSGGLAKIAKFAILALVVAMGLRAMGVANDIVNLAFALTFGAIAVAVALSFGLGGREAAGKLMDHWLSKFRSGDK